MRKVTCCGSKVEKKTVVEGFTQDGERERDSESKRETETLWAPARLEIVFPSCPRGQHQLSPKHYFNLEKKAKGR